MRYLRLAGRPGHIGLQPGDRHGRADWLRHSGKQRPIRADPGVLARAMLRYSVRALNIRKLS
jgi:hypothetical protein